MLLYDFPLIRSGLSIKSLGGLFTKTKVHDSTQIRSQPWLPKTYWQVVVAKTTSIELYRYKKSTKAQKIDLQFVTSADVYGQICNMQICTVKISESKQYMDIILLTLSSGELLVYNYSREQRRLICSYRELIFKVKGKSVNLDNARQIGNYITCSQQNHFLVSSVRCHRRLYQVQAVYSGDGVRVNLKGQDMHVKQNRVCWNVIWMPSMSNQQEYYGKYVAIEKQMMGLQGQGNMVDEREEGRNLQRGKRLRYYYVQRNYKLFQREQKKQGFKRLPQTAHMLIPISPSSFFILYQNSLYLRQLPNQKQQPKQQLIDTQFPLRQALVDKNIKCLFSCYSRQYLQDKKNVIYIVNQFGDLFKMEYYLTGTLVANFSVKYVNSVKTCHSIVYVGEVEKGVVQFGEQQAVKVAKETATLLLLGLERFSVSLYFVVTPQSGQTKAKETKVAIRPIGKPKTSRNYPQYSDKQSFNPISQRSKDLQLSDEIEHMGVIMDTKIANLRSSLDQIKNTEENFQIFALTNSGNLRHQQHIDQTIDNIQLHKSYLKVIKKGLNVREVNSLQWQKLHQIYCFKKSQKEPHHKIVILCAIGKTSVYTIASIFYPQTLDDAFTNYKELSFEETATSIYIGKLEDESYIQIVGNRIRHIRREKNGVKQLQIKNRIVLAVSLGRQLFVALYGGEVIFFEIDKDKDSLEMRKEFYVNDEIVAMELTPLENNKFQNGYLKRASRFMIVGTKNYEILIYKMVFKHEKETVFELIYEENVKAPIQSLAAIIVNPDDTNNVSQKSYFVFLGMDNGSLIRMEFDRSMKKKNHKLSSIGSRPVKLKKCSIASKRQDSLLIISDKTFLHYIHNGKYKMHLLATSNIDIAAEMRLPENLNTLLVFGEKTPPNKDAVRILSIDSFGEDFHDRRVDLFFSGKKLLIFDNNVGIIEADPSYEKMQKRKMERDIDVERNIIEIENLQKTWKSQFSIYKKDKDVKKPPFKKIAAIYFDQTKEICLCAAYNNIKNGINPGKFLIFGCAQGMTYYPKVEAKQQTIKIYSWTVQKKMNQDQNQYKTQFLYSLNIDGIPLVIEPFFKGEKFLIGIGKSLRLFQVGKKKLLLKAEINNLPSSVNQIKTIGKKIFITSVSDSFHLFKYIPEEKTFYDIAEDQLPKYITAMNIIDGQTVCAGDKFGNLFVGRLSENAKSEFETVSGSSKTLDSGHLCKFNTLARINVGDIVTSIHKVNLYTSKTDVIIYSTIMGQLRVLYPLTDYEEVKVLPLLEEKIREKYKIQDIQGNNWGARKQVVMGELVEKFLTMSEAEQKEILRETKVIEESYVDYLKDMIEGIRTKII